MKTREEYMQEALSMARQAAEKGEVPVGCVITGPDGEILARARNRCREDRDATAHAELLAIRQAEEVRQSPYLEDCTLYVTAEPCPMCAGAILHTRIGQIVYGCEEPLTGSCGSVINLFEEQYGHRPAIYGRVCAEESAALLHAFFDGLRRE